MKPVDNLLDALAEVGAGYKNAGDVERLEHQFLSAYLPMLDAPVVLDVGANTGGYSTKVRELSPNAEIYAFEPHPISFGELQNIAEEKQIQVFNFGFGSKDSLTTIYDVENENGSPLASLNQEVIETLHRRPSRAFPVRIKTLDKVISNLGLERIHLLKVDTEGHEMEVFRGAERALNDGRIDTVQFEFNDMNVYSRTFFKDFYDFLKNYRLFRLTPHGMMPIDEYVPALCEVFILQTIIGRRRDLA